ncbi:MAG TPA: retropepsin-like aspartic protease [Prolixibacteraceae bacterium]|jgi:hypothetical protein
MIELSLQVIELEQDNFHILIEGEFQDKTVSSWIIDTGASKSVMDVNQKAYYEILDSDNEDDYHSAGINQGMMETSVGKMFFLKFGKLEIINHKVALIDLDHVNEIYRKYTSCRIAGLLGGDILMQYKCCIDYEHKTIQFQLP